MMEAGVVVLTAFISPFRVDRERARNLFSPGDFIEIYCSASLEICESRDVKGLYAGARAGSVKEFTGISSPYEPPLQADLVVNTGGEALAVCVAQVTGLLLARGLVSG